MNKLKILLQAVAGNLFKIKVWFYLLFDIRPNHSTKIATNVIVSLTSYGSRVSKCVPYAVFSMIIQTVQPEKIILWLDKEKWNDEKLPFALRRMKGWGMLDIEYCVDIRSFTKLIPALEKYPDKTIVTVDDDIFYSSIILERLYLRHIEVPHKICALSFCIPKITIDGKICTYSSWKEYRTTKESDVFDEHILMPQGFAGVLYPPKAFDKEVLNKDIFLKFCPCADDIWFYIMAIKSGTLRTNVPGVIFRAYSVDLFRQIVAKDRLHEENVLRKQNDLQLKAILEHYQLKLK